MGGFGSGRDPYATTPTVEESRTLDVDNLTDAVEQPGEEAVVWWGDREDPDSWMTVRLQGDPGEDERATAIRLVYNLTNNRTGEESHHEYDVPLEYTEPNFGGVRPWFRCPGVVDGVRCGERVRKLYLPCRRGYELYLCRHCYDLGYRSSRTSGDEIARTEQRYRDAYATLDAKDRRPHPNDLGVPHVPARPKGMHRDTYADLVADLEQARDEWDRAFDSRLIELTGGLSL